MSACVLVKGRSRLSGEGVGLDDKHLSADEVVAILSDDYTRAEFLRDRLIPKAILFFTGEVIF